MILEKKIAEILDSGGFLSDFNDYRDRPQPAPGVQIISLDEPEQNERFIFIRENGGGGGNVYVQRPAVSISLFGLKDKSDAATVKDYADRILTHLLAVNENCGIIDINATASNLSVMFTESGRPVVEIQTTVLLDRGLN